MKLWVEYFDSDNTRRYVERNEGDRMLTGLDRTEGIDFGQFGVAIYYGDIESWRLIPWNRVIEVGRQP
jgi:hypothetical protein